MIGQKKELETMRVVFQHFQEVSEMIWGDLNTVKLVKEVTGGVLQNLIHSMHYPVI